MAARPYWSGNIQISLVSFAVNFFVATEAKSEIRFHQIHRGTGERVRHQKVSSDTDAPLENDDIVKGYEYSKGKYIQIEPDEIDALRLPSKHTIDVAQFVDSTEIPPEYFEKPYFVMPEDDGQHEAFAVVRAAMRESGKTAMGKMTFGGREHVVAIMAPEDEKQPGMMAYTLRYADELRDSSKYVSHEQSVQIDKDQLELAQQLIRKKSAKFDPKKFTDEYETALRELVNAKLKNKPLPKEEAAAPKQGKVINLMDALRSSLQRGKEPAVKTAGKKAAARKGPVLVHSKKPRSTAKRKMA